MLADPSAQAICCGVLPKLGLEVEQDGVPAIHKLPSFKDTLHDVDKYLLAGFALRIMCPQSSPVS